MERKLISALVLGAAVAGMSLLTACSSNSCCKPACEAPRPVCCGAAGHGVAVHHHHRHAHHVARAEANNNEGSVSDEHHEKRMMKHKKAAKKAAPAAEDNAAATTTTAPANTMNGTSTESLPSGS